MEPDDVARTLTTVQVDLARLGGDFRELAAEIRAGMATQRVEIRDLKGQVSDHGDRLQALERERDVAHGVARGRVAGIAVGVSLASSGITVGLFELLGRMP